MKSFEDLDSDLIEFNMGDKDSLAEPVLAILYNMSYYIYIMLYVMLMLILAIFILARLRAAQIGA